MPRVSQRYVLAPCSGRSHLGIVRGHVYRVYDMLNAENRSDDKDLGVMVSEEAVRRFGEENVFFSESDSLCDSCSRDILGEIEKLRPLVS